jgi:hypothetical protein
VYTHALLFSAQKSNTAQQKDVTSLAAVKDAQDYAPGSRLGRSAMNSILYLGIEGVVLRIFSQCPPGQHRVGRAPISHPLPLLRLISDIVTRQNDLSIVLNSWFICDYGYRSLLDLFPDAIACRTIGATIPGNRLHRHFIAYQPRADMLRADVRRRTPSQLTIIDGSHSAIPAEYENRSVWVTGLNAKTAQHIAARLTRLLEAVPS